MSMRVKPSSRNGRIGFRPISTDCPAPTRACSTPPTVIIQRCTVCRSLTRSAPFKKHTTYYCVMLCVYCASFYEFYVRISQNLRKFRKILENSSFLRARFVKNRKSPKELAVMLRVFAHHNTQTRIMSTALKRIRLLNA